MAGETTVIHLPFAGGLDEKIAKEYLDASSRQASIVNGDFVKVGVIDKRLGLAHLPTTLIAGGSLPALTTGTRVTGWSRSSLSVLCSTGLYQYVTAPVGGASAGGVVGVAQLPAVACQRTHITTGDQFAPPVLVDFTYSGQLLRIAVAWDTAYNLVASVYDVASGNMVLEPTQVYANSGTYGGGTIPIVISGFDLPGIANGNPRPLVVIHDLFDLSLKYVQYNPSTNAFTAPTVLVASCAFADAVPYEDDPLNGWLLAYNNGTTTIRLAYWTTAGLQTTVDQAIAGGHTMYFPCYVAGRYGQTVFVCWSTQNGGSFYHWAQARVANHTFGSLSSPYNYVTGSLAVSGLCTGVVHLGTNKILTSWYAQHDTSTLAAPLMQYWQVLAYSAGVISEWAGGHTSAGLLPATRPFIVNGEIYQPFYYNLDYRVGTNSLCQQITLYLCKYYGITDSMSAVSHNPLLIDVVRPVATIAPRTTSHAAQAYLDQLGDGHGGLPSTVSRTATRVAIGLKTAGESATVAGPSWAVDFFWDMSSEENLYQASELGSELSISGGVPFVADGQTAFEDGFFNYPEFSTANLEGTATPLATGQYSFAVIYRAEDSAGLTHRSAPYIPPPVSVTNLGAGPAVYVLAPIASYRDSNATATAPGRIYADIFMTTVNGGTFYYLDSIVVSNIDTSPWPTFVRYPASGQVAAQPPTTNPLLYTTGGVLDNVNPPASTIQTTHQGRKALVDETGQQVWFSKVFTTGEAPGFNEDLVIQFPDGGRIRALGSMDGKFFAFKLGSIWLMQGEGPSDTGQGSTWEVPQSLATDVGCKSWQSVVLTPKGLMFQAPNNGLYLLGRDLQVSFIGKSVIEQTNAYPTVLSATLVPSSTQVRFVCQNDAGNASIVVVYDYLLDQWTTHQYGQLSAPVASACLSFGAQQYSVLTTDGNLWQERPSTDANRYMDQDSSGTNHFVPTTIKIPYVKTQTQGFQRMKRVQFFGEQQDDCGLSMQFSFNYDDTVKQTESWSSVQLKPLGIRGQVETFVSALYNKQMSIQVTVSDTAGTAMTSGAGMRFSALALELQNLGPRYKLLGAGARR